MAIAVSTDQILIDIRSWYYRLRMVQAHLETSAVAGMTPAQLDFSLETVADLIGACEDAASFILTERAHLPSAEAGVGEAPDRGDGA